MTAPARMIATQHLTLAHDPTRDPALVESLTESMRASCHRHALGEGGVGIADEVRTRFWAESDGELASRQERENRISEEEGIEPRTLDRLHFAACDAEIVWPDPTPDGSPVLVAQSWHDLPERGLVVVTTNTAEHDHADWSGRLVWIDGARYRVTGAHDDSGLGLGVGKGTSMALYVEAEPMVAADV